jgi:uncharacterized protein DUF6104
VTVGLVVLDPTNFHDPANFLDRRGEACARGASSQWTMLGVYFTDRGIEELEQRRGEEEVTLAWVAERLREFVDANPEFEIPVERLATWLARLDDDE